MYDLIKIFYKVGLFTLKGIIAVIQSICNSGLNLMTILDLSNRVYGDKKAIQDDKEELTYFDLYQRSLDLAIALRIDMGMKERSKVVVICRNKISLLSILFALSRIGSDVFLINVDISKQQLSDFINKHKLKNLIYDREFDYLIDENNGLIFSISMDAIEILKKKRLDTKLKPSFFSKIIVLTAGTGGKLKVTERKPSVFNFIDPLCCLIKELNLLDYTKVYLATPIYHGYGLATICISIFLGAKIYLRPQFDPKESANLINQETIEVITVVPLMLNRLLQYDTELMSLKCIVSGGANLSSILIDKVIEKLGNNLLYNLYGTTEVGFCILATPADLLYSKTTIGRPIKGVNIKILRDDNTVIHNTEAGRICIVCNWSIDKDLYIETGDLGFEDDLGYIHLKGRSDEMIVSGGENVYPDEIESILLKHDNILEAVAIAVDDKEFGQRLCVYIVVDDKAIASSDIKLWIKDKVARFQVPREVIIVDSIPTTSIGKYNKKALAKTYLESLYSL